MIHDLTDIRTTPEYLGEELTVRCTVADGPRRGAEGGDKTLYPIETPDEPRSVDAFLSIWHEQPAWEGNIQTTSAAVRAALEDLALQPGESILARGVPNEYNGKWYFNVGDALIRTPETTIGKSEMRTASECPRIYDLAFKKNIYSPGRYDLSPGAIKGRIAHSVVERATTDETYQAQFDEGWSDDAIEACLESVVEGEYTVDLGLCRLAWVSSGRIINHARDAVGPLLKNGQFTDTIASADTVRAEVQLTESLGFNGRVDLVIDGVPYDLKTAYQPSARKKEIDRFQLRIYLFALLLESLEPGDAIGERLAEGVTGVLVYPSLKTESDVVFDEVTLHREDIESILRLRNDAVTLRDGFGVATTYGRDCEGCSFKSATMIGRGQVDSDDLGAPCQFYCQSERRWPCFETDDSGTVISQCPLFDECEERLDFRDPSVTDHYNELRTALNSERDARQRLGMELDRIDDDTLTRAGLRIPDLELAALEGRRRLVFTSQTPVVPTFSPGSQVRLVQTGTAFHTTATYYGRVESEDGADEPTRYVFQLSGQPSGAFLTPDATFEAVRTVSNAELPRELLRQLDYAQRAEVAPLLESIGTPGEAHITISPTDLEAVADHVRNKELYIDVPVRSDRTSVVTELVTHLGTATYLQPDDEEEPIPADDQRVLVLCSSPQTTDQVADGLADITQVARMDGFAGGTGTVVAAEEDGHNIYTALRDADVVVSSIQYALCDNVFHAMESGDPDARPHSTRFFDAVVLVGAEQLAEPQFHFLQVLGDRTIAIGDTHRYGPELVSGEAHESRLSEAYFNRLYRRFANIETEASQSLQLPAEITQPMIAPFSDLDIDATVIDGSVEFVDVTGESTAAVTETTITHRIDTTTDGEEPRFLRLQPVGPVDTTQITERLSQLRTLDASTLTTQNTYTVQGIQFEVLTNTPGEGDHHRLDVNVSIQATPYLNRRLTHNTEEAEKVAEICADRSVDVVVTPFVAHANAIRDKLTDQERQIPVRLPTQLDGEQVETAVVSLAVAGDDRIVRPPASDIETLYSALHAGRTTILVGDCTTLERNSVLQQVLAETVRID